MKNLKFRIWDSRNKAFWRAASDIVKSLKEGEVIWGDLEPYKITLDGFPVSEDGTMSMPIDEKFELNQFTGIVDKNGKDIYEHDIVKFDIKGHTHGPGREDDNIEYVWYSEEDACWALGHHTTRVTPTLSAGHTFAAYEYTWWYTFQDDIDRETLEVIGNIYENLELVTLKNFHEV